MALQPIFGSECCFLGDEEKPYFDGFVWTDYAFWKLEEIFTLLRWNSAALFFDIATQTLGGFSPENGALFRRGTGGVAALKPAKKTVAMNHPQRYNATNQRDEKTLPARTGHGTPGLAGSVRLTTCLTTDSSGARGNSEFKRFKEYAKTSGNDRKYRETRRKNLVQPFGKFHAAETSKLQKKLLISS